MLILCKRNFSPCKKGTCLPKRSLNRRGEIYFVDISFALFDFVKMYNIQTRMILPYNLTLRYNIPSTLSSPYSSNIFLYHFMSFLEENFSVSVPYFSMHPGVICGNLYGFCCYVQSSKGKSGLPNKLPTLL